MPQGCRQEGGRRAGRREDEELGVEETTLLTPRFSRQKVPTAQGLREELEGLASGGLQLGGVYLDEPRRHRQEAKLREAYAGVLLHIRTPPRRPHGHPSAQHVEETLRGERPHGLAAVQRQDPHLGRRLRDTIPMPLLQVWTISGHELQLQGPELYAQGRRCPQVDRGPERGGHVQRDARLHECIPGAQAQDDQAPVAGLPQPPRRAQDPRD
mmetsp:Transcript_94563/g.246704  ORF Transcript_94563/g.246704 Transcript_94563/m.246704 type:complete len:212 (+) Transcript_94563:320-955(+)